MLSIESLGRARRRWIFGVALAGSVAGGGVVGAQISDRHGGVSRFAAVDETDYICTTATEYVDIPGLEANFELHTRNSVVALFQARWRLGDQAVNPPHNGIPRIRLLVDGIPLPGPGGDGAVVVPGVARVQDETTGGFNFISQRLRRGAHTAKMQWRSEGVDDEICMEARSLVVLHD